MTKAEWAKRLREDLEETQRMKEDGLIIDGVPVKPMGDEIEPLTEEDELILDKIRDRLNEEEQGLSDDDE